MQEKKVAINEEVSKLKQMLSEQSIASHSSGSEATSATHQAPSYHSPLLPLNRITSVADKEDVKPLLLKARAGIGTKKLVLVSQT